MQTLVYIFIGLAGLGVGAVAYFGFTFSPIEAFVTALAFCAVATVVFERTLRQRSEARLEKAIGDLSRLLSTNAQAGASLSQRVNALADQNAGARLEALEADVSVLGTVARQVAEAVAELEERMAAPPPRPAPADMPDPDTFPEPVVPLGEVRRALDEGRLLCHLQPIARLPHRKPYGYRLVPRIRLEDGGLAEPPDYMPRRGGADVIRRIEALGAAEAVDIARRSRTEGLQTELHVPLSRATLGDAGAVEALLASLDANKAVAHTLMFELTLSEYRALDADQRAALSGLVARGVGLAIAEADSLRVDFAELQGLSVHAIGIDASRFAHRPESFTDFHAADVAAYARRYGIELIGCNVIDEQQLLRLFEDGIVLAEGPHIGATAPARPEMQPRRAAAGVASRRVGA
jgi:cyclic-di-GMP phosphodiesterase TipF (flagellum assembly factor)